MAYNLLIIDDEPDIRNLLARILELEGYAVATAGTAGAGLNALKKRETHVVLTDIRLPDIHGVELTRRIKAEFPESEVICLTAYGTVEDGVQAMKNGAFDYLVKGDDQTRILPLVEKAAEKASLQFRIKHLEDRLTTRYRFDRIIGRSAAIREAVGLAEKVAATDTTVLLTGATGSGKEVFAQAIHNAGGRRSKPFVAVNCSAVGKDILESEMFGHRAGAFTGAIRDKKGLFEEAHRGTLFLDEIGEMSLDLQARLLRVLETGTFIKLGETKETHVDVRIIAATNRRLEAEVEAGRFREDLFYRLSVFHIRLPGLNERSEDIPELAAHFTGEFAAKTKKKPPRPAPEFVQALQTHNWKGNIRELRNVIERAVILCDGDALTPDLLPFFPSGETHPELPLRLKDVEKQHIRRVLQQTGGNKTRAARLLDIGLTTLYAKIQEYGL